MESGDDTLKVHELAEYRGAIVPALWHTEVANVPGTKLRKGEISSITLKNALDLLASTPIAIDRKSLHMDDLLPLMASYGLTAYDATYLELALRLQLPIATLDKKLSRARQAAGLPLLYELMS